MKRVTFRNLSIGISVLVVIITMVVRVCIEGSAEYAQAETFLKSGDVDAAIVHYRRAARWYLPLYSTPTKALESLERIGRTQHESGDTHGALAAFRSIRAAIMSTRSFYTPHGAILERTNTEIATLMAELPPIPEDAAKSKSDLRAEYLHELKAARGPNTFWAGVLLLGFCCWIGGAFAFFYRAFDEEQHLQFIPALRWGALIAFGMMCFVLGASFA